MQIINEADCGLSSPETTGSGLQRPVEPASTAVWHALRHKICMMCQMSLMNDLAICLLPYAPACVA
jgi:hypothetical protein